MVGLGIEWNHILYISISNFAVSAIASTVKRSYYRFSGYAWAVGRAELEASHEVAHVGCDGATLYCSDNCVI
jgi:hypothetical protein